MYNPHGGAGDFCWEGGGVCVENLRSTGKLPRELQNVGGRASHFDKFREYVMGNFLEN